MSSSTLKILALAMVVLALVAATVAYRVGQTYSEQAREVRAQQQAAQRQRPQTLAVVASAPLLAFQPIRRDDIAVVPVEIAPPTVFASLDDVEGRVPLIDVDPGTPLTERYFRTESQMSRIIPEGHKGVSVEINDVVAVGGFVRPGDVVDVLLFVRGVGSNQTSQARAVLREVTVLGYDSRIIDRPEGAEEPDGQSARSSRRTRTRTAVLAIPDEDINRLLLADSVGNLRLALHASKPPEEGGSSRDDDGGLPLLADSEPAVEDIDEDDLGDPITAEELTALAKKKDDTPPRPPPPPPVYVYRGDDVSAVRP